MSILNMRRGQRTFFRMVDQYRICAFLARRQYGKTTTFAKIALKKMMKQRDHTVIFGSAKLSLSREIVRSESRILQAAIQAAVTEIPDGATLFKIFDSSSGKSPDKLTPDDFAEIFEAQRLEFRIYFSRTSYSRTKVVALHPDTVGETGDLMCDELRAIRNWREVWEAVKPIISSNPQFRCTLSTTVPTDDSHYAYGQLLPPVGLDFKPNPDGNIYESQGGIMTCRVDAWDAAADSVMLFDDKTGEPLTPEESRRRDQDKDAWDRNYGLLFIAGGTSACGITQLDTAQRRGVGKCCFVLVDADSDFDRAIAELPNLLGPGKTGIGFDVATTTKGYSNPSAVAICQQNGLEYSFPLIIAWKTADPRIAEERIERIIKAVAKRPDGGKARSLHIDATNERYFATGLRQNLAAHLPVTLVIGSETDNRPGYEPMTKKQLLGSRLIAELDDNHLTLPPERYLRDDWRLVKKDRGSLTCDPDVDGKHGDTFDAAKLALNALVAGGPVEIQAAPISTIANNYSPTFAVGGHGRPFMR
ncbi:MAG TPA: hypothetical protein PKE26_11000 [Kiritimatiellia bacterium]|nr:hypothetical protein [Kiritimatiellia bacterium]HMO99626.1 hypothetical protein [Kiritimatiellia bacterium]HMP97127.1 hypothetical protein [Kiritimatiellia bacterium]